MTRRQALLFVILVRVWEQLGSFAVVVQAAEVAVYALGEELVHDDLSGP